jgi:metal-responsive CopG/Arc/MetJ family transcriptional regulator
MRTGQRVSVALNDIELAKLDAIVRESGFDSRSDALRALIGAEYEEMRARFPRNRHGVPGPKSEQ